MVATGRTHFFRSVVNGMLVTTPVEEKIATPCPACGQYHRSADAEANIALVKWAFVVGIVIFLVTLLPNPFGPDKFGSNIKAGQSWEGTMRCAGLDGVLKVTIGQLDDKHFDATVDFALGDYQGSYASRLSVGVTRIFIEPDHWIAKADGYEMDNLTGTGLSDTAMNGTVEGCGTFELNLRK